MTRFVCRLLLVLAFVSPALAAPAVPPDLAPWQDWALHGAESVRCPFLAGDANRRHCAWPGTLALSVDEAGARFAFPVRVYAESWVALPGDADHWPQDARVDGRPVPLVLRAGAPQVKLAAGEYRLEGQWRWARRPESLALGIAGALVQLEIDGRRETPVVDETGRLWFGRAPAAAPVATARNAVTTRVFRRLADGVPPMLTTRIELDVSGADRELLVGRALPEGFAPVSLAGALPARLEPDGNLRVQVRAGRWSLLLESRQLAPATDYRMEAREGWPAQEVWVFAADHRLRTVALSGAPAVDPRQTGLPQEWQSLPAWVLGPGVALVLREQVRGDSSPQPEPLALTRELWLDFDGGALTARDVLRGELSRSDRLAFASGVEPGRVTLNGEPQVITRLAGGEGAGIEVRPGPVVLEAVSRVPLDAPLVASGWSRDVDALSARLQLPPGWTLLAASGVDRASPSWVSGWTLWDIFLVLVLTVAVARLFDARVAALMFATLLVTQDIDGAPLFLWLNLVAVIAVWRALPDGTFRRVVNGWRLASLGLLAVVAVLFAVDQVRQGLFPELEYPWRDIHAQVPEAPAAAAEADVLAEAGHPELQALEETREVRALASAPLRGKLQALQDGAAGTAAVPAAVDAGARVQTGPGVPAWQWNAVVLHWEGPVAQSRELQLWLLGPAANRALCFLRVLLVAVLLFALWQGRWPSLRLPVRAAAPALLAVAALAGTGFPLPAQAALPDAALLTELRNRLTAAPDCLPACAAIAGARIEAGDDAVLVRLRVDAAHRVAVPLPGGGPGWRPGSVLLDGKPAVLLRQDGAWQVAVEPGVHELLMRGPAPEQVTLAFPLRPGRVVVQAPGWQVGGLADGRLAGDALELRRASAPAREAARERKLLNDPEPPFVVVERTLQLDIDWTVVTRVVRVAPQAAPFTVAVPLLAGETPTSRVNLQDGAVLAAFAQGQSVVEWQSVLRPAPALALQAAQSPALVERWTLAASTRWHVAHAGVPPVKGGGGTAWYPWPGESLQLTVTRPQPLPGDTLTVEQVRLEHRPGHHASATRLEARLLSSEGGDWRFALPAGAVLERVEVDGVDQVLAGAAGEVVVPVHPGEQQVAVDWRSDEGMAVMARTPALQLGRPLANVDLVMHVPAERWPLFAGGPGAGPAVLYWGVLVVVLLVAAGLGRVPGSPLRTHEWALLGVGMSSTMLPWTLVVVAWFFLLVARGRVDPGRWHRGFFNFTQVLLALFTVLALGVLFSTIPQSLVLGRPDMQVEGNGSGGGLLHWFIDRTAGDVAQGWLVSLPMWAYRVLMLAWSLWLALALVRWLKWGWQQYGAGGLWQSGPAPLAGDRAYVEPPAGEAAVSPAGDPDTRRE